MKVRRATPKETRFACVHFHYAHAVPSVSYSYSVFNGSDEWCGVVTFSAGANRNIGKPYGLFMGEVLELVRVALNGKQEITSQAVAMCVKALKTDVPTVRLLVSYADSAQGHVGTIYKAMNWTYVGISKDQPYFVINGVPRHKKYLDSHGWKASIDWLSSHVDKSASLKPGGDKYKYLYPLDRQMRKKVLPLAKPYPS